MIHGQLSLLISGKCTQEDFNLLHLQLFCYDNKGLMKPFVSGYHSYIDNDLPLNHTYATFFHSKRLSIVNGPTGFCIDIYERKGERKRCLVPF